MQTSSTSPTKRGTNVKQEQRSVCSNIQQTTQTLARRAGTGIAKQLMLLWLLAFTLMGGTAWGQTAITEPGEYTLQCGTTYDVDATAEGVYTFINNTGSPITISDITVKTLRYYSSSSGTELFDYVKINGKDNGNINNGYSSSCYSSGNRNTYPRSSDKVDNVTIASGQSATFEIVNNIDNNRKDGCTPAGFSFTVTTSPVLIEPADGANISSGASVDFRWEKFQNVNSYTLYIDDDATVIDVTTTGDNSNPTIDNNNVITYTPTTALAAGVHTWKVVPNDANGTPLSNNCLANRYFGKQYLYNQRYLHSAYRCTVCYHRGYWWRWSRRVSNCRRSHRSRRWRWWRCLFQNTVRCF